MRRGEEHGAAARLGRRAIAADELLAQDEHARRADAAGQLVARKHQRVGRDAAGEVESRRVVRGGGRPVEDGQGPPSFETLRDGADVAERAVAVARVLEVRVGVDAQGPEPRVAHARREVRLGRRGRA